MHPYEVNLNVALERRHAAESGDRVPLYVIDVRLLIDSYASRS
jgi:hypothetical protein